MRGSGAWTSVPAVREGGAFCRGERTSPIRLAVSPSCTGHSGCTVDVSMSSSVEVSVHLAEISSPTREGSGREAREPSSPPHAKLSSVSM